MGVGAGGQEIERGSGSVSATIRYRGDRLILADASSADEVALFTEGAGFTDGRENNTPYGSEKVWVIAGGLYFHYVSNRQAAVDYVQVTGDGVALNIAGINTGSFSSTLVALSSTAGLKAKTELKS